MARPNKQGLDYFPLDVDFFDDEKIEAISGEFGLKGEVTTIKLLCAIYRNGYFIVWSDLLKMKLLKNLNGVSKELLEQIVLRLVRWNFFDESLFNSDNVLTSKGIQTRYIEATKRRKNTEKLQYWLLKRVNVNINRVKVNINAQSKVNKSKEIEKEEDAREGISKTELITNSQLEFAKECIKDTLWIETVQMQTNIPDKRIEVFKTKLWEFCKHLGTDETEHQTLKDFKYHFKSWLRIQVDKYNKSKAKNKNNKPNFNYGDV